MSHDLPDLNTGKTIREVLDYLINVKKLYKDDSDFCRKNNIPRTTLNSQFDKKNTISPTMLEISKILEMNLNYFFNKKRGMFLNNYNPYIFNIEDLRSFKSDFNKNQDKYNFLCLPPFFNKVILNGYTKEELNNIVAYQNEENIYYLDYNDEVLKDIKKAEYLIESKDNNLLFAKINPTLKSYTIEIDDIKETIENKKEIMIIAKVLAKLNIEIL